MSGSCRGLKSSLNVAEREAEIVAHRNAGRSLRETARLVDLSPEGVRQVLNRRPAATANKTRKNQAYARLEAAGGLTCIQAGMSVLRLAAIADTTPRRVEQWLEFKGMTKYLYL